MRIAVEDYYGATFSVERAQNAEADFTLGEVIEGFVRPLLRAMGFLDSSIIKYLGHPDEDAHDRLARRESYKCR